MQEITKPVPRSPRRWLQVRLSSLLWLTTVVALACLVIREHFTLRQLEQDVIESREQLQHLAHMEWTFAISSAHAQRQVSELRAEADSLKQQLRVVKELEAEAQQKVAILQRVRVQANHAIDGSPE
jgi:hypothetical protein